MIVLILCSRKKAVRFFISDFDWNDFRVSFHIKKSLVEKKNVFSAVSQKKEQNKGKKIVVIVETVEN